MGARLLEPSTLRVAGRAAGPSPALAGPRPLPRWASTPGVLAGLAVLVLLLCTSSGYGYHRDELYFLQAGRHLAWGYPDQPPLTPLLARLFGSGSLLVLRLPSAVSCATVVVLAGVLAERLGARRSGQWLAAGATALCGPTLMLGHLLSTATPLYLGTVLITYLVVRVQQGGDRRLWLLMGVVGGVTFQAHVLAGFVLLALAITSGLRRGAVAAGAVALLLGAPYVLWQALHGWPQVTVAHGIAAGDSTSSVPRALLVALLLLQVGPWLAPVWVTGLVRVLKDRTLRGLALAFLLLTVVFIMLGGKPYYVAGFVPLFLAAGAQPVVDRVAGWVPVALLLLSTPALVFTLPLLPSSASGLVVSVNAEAGETIGWASFARQVSAVVPAGYVVVTSGYGEAGALQRYTSLPVYSGHNGYGLWAVPPGSTPALLVGLKPSYCRRLTEVGRVHMPVHNEENGTILRTCTPREPWVALWPQVRHVG